MPQRPTADAPDPAAGLDLSTARRWALTAAAMLAAERSRLDGLNVFPVPDGDTGTNLLLTLEGGLRHLRREERAGRTFTLAEGLDVLARGTLHAARGNSGVILSQLVRGLAAVDTGSGDAASAADAAAVAAAFATAARTARSGIARPVEGTMLSVAEAASGAAASLVERAGDSVDVTAVVDAALLAAREALDRTPEQLPALARAGVVDAGGAGLVIVLEALALVLGGEEPAEHARAAWRRGLDDTDDGRVTQDAEGPGPVAPEPGQADPILAGEPADGRADVEVMYLLEAATGSAVDALRARLDGIGDSVVVAGAAPQWQVHVHVPAEEAASAIDAGALAGRVSRVRVTDLALAHGGDLPTEPTGRRPRLGLVACAPGPGVAALFEQAGAVVVPSDAVRRASIGQLMSAAWVTGADDVLVLANDATTRDALAAAVGDDGLVDARSQGPRIHVLDSTSAVAGLAAAAVFDDAASPPQGRRALEQAIDATRHGSVARADRDAVTEAGPCRAGQALGLIDWEVVAVADTAEDALRGVVDALLAGQPLTDLLTVLVGSDATGGSLDAAREVVAALRSDPDHPTFHEVLEPGGQPTYAYLVGAEA